jgi:hypothetical protein
MSQSITPSLELVQQWWDDFNGAFYEFEAITAKVFQAGADQELEACCEWLSVPCPSYGRELRNARRPKPPSLKEQAFEQLDGIATVFRMSHGGDLVCDKILRALEALPND